MRKKNEMNDYMVLRRLAVTAALAYGAFAAWAMPTKTELAQAQQLVQDLTAEDLRAMKAGTKKPGEVAAAQLAFADEAETEAGKYLLLQGAFKLYARAADYGESSEGAGHLPRCATYHEMPQGAGGGGIRRQGEAGRQGRPTPLGGVPCWNG